MPTAKPKRKLDTPPPSSEPKRPPQARKLQRNLPTDLSGRVKHSDKSQTLVDAARAAGDMEPEEVDHACWQIDNPAEISGWKAEGYVPVIQKATKEPYRLGGMVLTKIPRKVFDEHMREAELRSHAMVGSTGAQSEAGVRRGPAPDGLMYPDQMGMEDQAALEHVAYRGADELRDESGEKVETAF